MVKIFVSAYACEPGLGSEIGVGWHWVLVMSKYFELWVLTRESNRKSIEPWIAEHPEFCGIHWLYYDLPQWARWWKKGLRGVRTYYNIWQWRTGGIVRRTMQDNDIRVYHHLTYGNALWRVNFKPNTFCNMLQNRKRENLLQNREMDEKVWVIWGPIGGLETIPEEFSRHYGLKWRMVEAIRRMAVSMLPLNRGFYKRCEEADLIFCKTEETMRHIPEEYREKAMLMTDVAVEYSPTDYTDVTDHSPLRFITVGRLEGWRGFDLVIEAFAMLAGRKDDVELSIVGNGSDRKRLERLIAEKHLEDRIKLTGTVSMERYNELMKGCDVVVNAALKEGAVTVAFDAIANRKAIVCVDTGGYTRALTLEMSEVVGLNSDEFCNMLQNTGRVAAIGSLYHAMERFCDVEERRKAAMECSSMIKKLCWEEKGKQINDAILTKLQEFIT